MKPIKSYLLLVFSTLLANVALAQQPAQYSIYMFNKYAFNAGYAGLDESVSITGVYRQQWVGLEGSPATQNLNVHMPLYFMKGAVGLGVENDVLGAERNLSVTATYAYQQELGDGYLSIGLRGGVFQKTIDGSLLNPRDQDLIDNNIPLGLEVSLAPILDAGIYFKQDNFEVGVSSSNLLENSASFALNEPTSIKFLRNYFFTFAYHLRISSKVDMTPSVLVKSDLNEHQIDFSSIFTYDDNIVFGASFRGYNQNTIDAVVILAGMQVSKNIRIAYAYDLPLSGLNNANSGSHEILLNYNLNKAFGVPRPPKIIYNPRFL